MLLPSRRKRRRPSVVAELNPLLAYGTWLAETPDAWPAEAVRSARNAFIDTLGVAIPGAAEPVTRKVLATVRPWGEGPCTVIGSNLGLAAPWAALVNGTAAHALDFDDNFDPAKAHASAVLVPAILALAEQEGASGRACLDAYIAALQIMGRVGQGVNPAHRNRGWHATATVGAIGAAAACARLLRLTGDEAAFALSIATSMAGGFMSQFGTSVKPIHAGLAAKAGVTAASLARAGLDAGLHTLDGPKGMNRLMVGPDLDELRANLTHIEHGQTLRFETADVGEPLLILSSGLKVKRFPNCGSAHRAMDGLLALIEEHGFAAQDIAEVRVSAPASHLANLMYEAPANPAQAKFSLEYALAMIALHRRCSLGDFEDPAVHAPEARAFFGKVRRIPVDKSEGEFPTQVEVALTSGTSHCTAVEMPIGSLAAPLAERQYGLKFDECAERFIPPGELAELQGELGKLADLESIAPVMDRLAHPWTHHG
jgi:2-methylcitrate dehydratase PrpD